MQRNKTAGFLASVHITYRVENLPFSSTQLQTQPECKDNNDNDTYL